MRHADTVYGTLANMNEADFFRQEQPNIVGVLLLHKQIQIQYKNGLQTDGISITTCSRMDMHMDT